VTMKVVDARSVGKKYIEVSPLLLLDLGFSSVGSAEILVNHK